MLTQTFVIISEVLVRSHALRHTEMGFFKKIYTFASLSSSQLSIRGWALKCEVIGATSVLFIG
jgi:hypothetical protein